MAEKCQSCGAKMVYRTYPLVNSSKNFRLLRHCSKKVLHTYSPETLSGIDYEKINEVSEKIESALKNVRESEVA